MNLEQKKEVRWTKHFHQKNIEVIEIDSTGEPEKQNHHFQVHLTLKIPWVIKTEFLLTIFKQALHENHKKCHLGILVDLIPNSLKIVKIAGRQ